MIFRPEGDDSARALAETEEVGFASDPRPEPPPWENFHSEIKATLKGKQNALDSLPLIRGGAKGDGQIKPLMANVVTLLRAEQHLFNLRQDEFSERSHRGDAPLTDDDMLDITNWVQRRGIHAEMRTVSQAVLMVSRDDRFHQVRDYLNPLAWDGTARLDMMLIDHAGVVDTPLARAFTAKWMIQAVARIMKPGCQADATLIVEGPQGYLKSSLFSVLFGKWFVSGLSDLKSKDARQELRGVWCIEFAELNALKRSDADSIKAFLTQRVDHYRDSYARMAADFPRQCVFVGTVNPGANGYLKDETGGRRFWPVTVTERVDLAAIAANRDQYWAEAVFRFNAGEPWYLNTNDLHAAADEAQSDRYEEDEWTAIIEKYLEEDRFKDVRGRPITPPNWVTITEILREAIGLEATAKHSPAEQKRVGRCLKRLKWRRVKRRNGEKKPKWAFEKGERTPSPAGEGT